MIDRGLFTSEAVSDGHPDKICDQISDAILDACLAQDPTSRVALECAIKDHTICLLGEITTAAKFDLRNVARSVLQHVGHDTDRWGLDLNRLHFVEVVSQQSPEIGAGVNRPETGAGDQGLMFGFAIRETPELMPLPISLAHALTERHRQLRQSSIGKVLGPDAKSQVTIRYQDRTPADLDTVVFSTQHSVDIELHDLRELIRDEILRPVLGNQLTDEVRLHLNPAGTFYVGGPVADAGLTGRKIIVDTYGGFARHGGGAFSGKDATKVDRSAAYGARQLARDVVARGWAHACEVRVAYAIGIAHPVDVAFETFGTEVDAAPADRYREVGLDILDLMRPASIIDRLQLKRPVFRTTATGGHFGREDFSWEQPLEAGQ